jgi:hypothetical protein
MNGQAIPRPKAITPVTIEVIPQHLYFADLVLAQQHILY